MKKDFVLTILIAVIWTASLLSSRSLAYSTTTSNTPLLPLPSLIDPINVLKNSLLKNTTPNLKNFSIGTTMPNLNLLNTQNLSGGDLLGALKAVAVLAINLFLIVIQTTAAILKALLPFLS